MDAMFQKYKDDGADSMSIQGVLALAGDLSLEMTDLRVTILLAYFNFVKLTSTKTDFLKGLSELRCDNMTALGSKLAQLQDAMATDDALFKRVFEYSYVGNLEVCSCTAPHTTCNHPVPRCSPVKKPSSAKLRACCCLCCWARGGP